MDYCCRHFIRLGFLLIAIIVGTIYFENYHREDGIQSGWKPWLCARLITTAEAHIDLNEQKTDLLKDVSGVVVEVGCGSGQNFRFYPPAVTKLIAIEPNLEMYPFIEESKKLLSADVELSVIPGIAQEISHLPDDSVDAVVAFHVLCTIRNVPQALEEARRVLKPGGKFVFLEHVVDPHPTVRQTIQHWISPLWRVLGDGCRPNLETWKEILNVFPNAVIQHFEAPINNAIIQPHIMGEATK